MVNFGLFEVPNSIFFAMIQNLNTIRINDRTNVLQFHSLKSFIFPLAKICRFRSDSRCFSVHGTLPLMSEMSGSWAMPLENIRFYPPMRGGWNPFRFSENNSRTDRGIVTKLSNISNLWTILHPNNLIVLQKLYTLIISRPYLLIPLTCDLISKVISSEICVPYRFDARNWRNSAYLLVILRVKWKGRICEQYNMDIDRCCEVTSMVYTESVTFPMLTEVIWG